MNVKCYTKTQIINLIGEYCKQLKMEKNTKIQKNVNCKNKTWTTQRNKRMQDRKKECKYEELWIKCKQ